MMRAATANGAAQARLVSNGTAGRTVGPVTVVVPCYNEEDALPSAIVEIQRRISRHDGWELVLVDDGSSDRTAELLAPLAEGHPATVVVSHDRNLGYGAALKTGIRAASHDLIVIADADGTYPIDRIEELVALTARNDMVVGSRTGEGVTYPFIRRVPKFFLTAYASWLAGRPIPDLNSGFRAFRREQMERFFPVLSDKFSFTSTSTLAYMTNGLRVHYLPTGYTERLGSSKIAPIRDTLRFSQLILRLGMYFAPLRVFSPIIVILTLVFLASLCYDVFVLANLTDKTVIFLMFAMNTTFFALLADMIDKRGQ